MNPLQKYSDDLRIASAVELEAKAEADGIVSGWASTYDGEPDRHGDIVVKGAFTKSLASHASRGSRPAMLWQHRIEDPIGHWTEIQDEAKGLRVTGKFNLKTERGREAFEHARAGDIASFSIGFVTPENGRRYLGKGAWALEEVDLVEISLVSAPANPNAVVTAIKAAPFLSTKPEAVEFLRKAGLPKAAAERFAAGGFPALTADPFAQERAQKLADMIEKATNRMRIT
ncbi:HK97 family phage prohead protease [Paracoccus beibuensis]|uniref:HK97 family phage prohead protease n=1 Tax=Paracoccus beibuensis TaxID=547602 RepID=UPI00223ED290|nr:HK97 family phage prohead protease [Paracoccus beibuensis]